MTLSVEQALAQANFFSDDKTYQIIKLPARAIMVAAGIIAEISTPFNALIVDKDEVSLILVPEAIEDFESRLGTYQVGDVDYRLITIDIELDLNMVGFMAVVSTALAQAGVNILTYGAYTRDHFLVPADKFTTAMNTLKQLQSNYK